MEGGKFENRIRIAQNRQIVLGGDELITVRCLYGPPQARGFSLPPPDCNVQTTPVVSLIAADDGLTGRDPRVSVAGANRPTRFEVRRSE